MNRYRKNKIDPKTGARVSYTLLKYGTGQKVLHRGWIRRGGIEWRVSAPTKEECEAKVREKLVELESEGVTATGLSVEEKRDAGKARKLLGEKETLEGAMKELEVVRATLGSGRKLLDALDAIREVRKILAGRATAKDAAEFWAARHPAGASVSLGEARDAYMKTQGKKSSGYKRTMAYRLEALVSGLGQNVPVAQVGEEDVLAVLSDWRENHAPFSDASWNCWAGMFRSFFKWAVETYHLPSNPAAGLKKRELEAGEVDFLGAAAVEKLLRAAERIAPEYVPAVAIHFFAGLRPTEIVGQYGNSGEGVRGGLDWDCVDVDGEIFLAGRHVKTRRQRQVPISDNLRAWLDAYGGEKHGRLVPNPQAWKRIRKAIEKEAGVKWPQDYARHSYASMHYALHKNRALLEAAMGHDAASRVLEQNYKRPVRKSEAERYWAIMPSPDNVKNPVEPSAEKGRT